MREKSSSYNFVFNQNKLLIFGKAIHNSRDLIWSKAKLKGCRFCVTQSWWRAIHRFGLMEKNKTKTEVGR